MKNLHFILLVVAVGLFASCKKEDNGLRSSGVLALNAPKELAASRTASTKAADGEQQRFTPREVIEQATEFFFYYRDSDKTRQPVQGHIADHLRDLINNRILLYNTDVIDDLGRLNTNFLDGSDFLLLIDKGFNSYGYPPGHPYQYLYQAYDTVAYIPFQIRKTVSEKIKYCVSRQMRIVSP